MPATFYNQTINENKDILTALKKKSSMVSWIRLLCIVVFLLAGFSVWQNAAAFSIALLVASIICFGYLVIYSGRLQEKIVHLTALVETCKKELAWINGNYRLYNNGAEWLTVLNDETNDLDSFGEASLFQFLNRTNSYLGGLQLAHSIQGKTTKKVILQNQEAIRELKDKPEWILEAHVRSQKAPIPRDTYEHLKNWLNHTSSAFQAEIWHLMPVIVPVISVSTIIALVASAIPFSLFNIVMLAILIVNFSIYKKVTAEYIHLSNVADKIQALSPAFKHIEDASFKSEKLNVIQQSFSDKETGVSSQAISELKRILKRFDYRLNPIVYTILSAVLFWDLRQVFALEKWKLKYNHQFENWLQANAEIEKLVSYATVAFNKPHWVFPDISDNWFTLEMAKVGHPLIVETKSVTNQFSMDHAPTVTIITGSNMAGKSTYLRTVGTNILLAMAGGVVCSEKMVCSVMRPVCSMRIADNLSEDTSTFYAELLKMKTIVTAIKNQEHVIVLVDEMLRGTNTFDRHLGSKAFIQQMIKQNAVGIVATHDVALVELKDIYHDDILLGYFDSVINNDEIEFDYKYKDGVCKTTNASLLMKKIGLEV
ncbi:MutS-related protein [Polluticaenibacter yanchengensis]|uniref:DNA mismatch repair proteins mutS family domain-containing protein n=1 Tax=Polluticaenibacter yanchengensis TaxID=3014562 RepID=A0ABT4UKX4_9BACT|nr:hypothetical protein [Chitinophagaceae bacterium LY-5]